jgi:hypothetical protein
MSGQADDLTPFTRALANVPPSPGRLDRDNLLFAAGRAAGRRAVVFWPVTAAALAGLSTVLALVLLNRPPTVVERVVHIPAPVLPDAPPPAPVGPRDDHSAPTPSSPSPSLAAALRLRQRVLREGIGEVPQVPWAAESPASSSSEVPDLSSLRLNASHSDGERFQ